VKRRRTFSNLETLEFHIITKENIVGRNSKIISSEEIIVRSVLRLRIHKTTKKILEVGFVVYETEIIRRMAKQILETGVTMKILKRDRKFLR
jgi:hypothetical protein